jgi:ADP-ribose pyrophosphatase YjhB (NUDIX family)
VKYCPRCATELTTRFEGGRDRIACPACSFMFFGDFSIGCGGVVIRDNKALLIRRGHEPGRGWWQIPGGYVEHDEVVTHAVEREVLEEAGVTATVVDVLGLRHSVGGTGSIGGPSSNVYVIFRLQPVSGEPACDGNEVTGAGYFSLDEIDKMERVQGLSKFAIGKALAERTGFTPAQAGTDPNRPGWVLFGLHTEG